MRAMRSSCSATATARAGARRPTLFRLFAPPVALVRWLSGAQRPERRSAVLIERELADEVVMEDADSPTLVVDVIVEPVVRIARARPGWRERVERGSTARS